MLIKSAQPLTKIKSEAYEIKVLLPFAVLFWAITTLFYLILTGDICIIFSIYILTFSRDKCVYI